MLKKALIAVASVTLSAPAFAGSIGNIQGTTSTTLTGGTRSVAINGNYASREDTVSASTDGVGSSASATFASDTGIAALSALGTGGSPSNLASATYSTNAVTGATYGNSQQSNFTGTEASTTAGVFFNY
jgi:hypothetical protein